MKPRRAPTHRPGPKPSRRDAAAPSDRSDKWPNRTTRRKPRSTRRRCTPSGPRCKAANRAILPPRAAARHTRTRSFPANHRPHRVSDKTFRTTRSTGSPSAFRMDSLRPKSPRWRPVPRGSCWLQFPCRRAPFRARRERPGLAPAAACPLPFVPPRAGPGPGAQPRLFVPLQFAVSGTTRKQPARR
jgi:hypothetical protein